MSKEPKSLYEKNLNDAIKMKEKSLELLTKSTNINQKLSVSKSYDTLSKQCALYEKCINYYSTQVVAKDDFYKSTIIIKELNLPLLWGEEYKKKSISHVFFYFCFQWENSLIDSDLVETSPADNRVQIENIKLNGVYPDSILKITAHYIIPSNSSKNSSKAKESKLENSLFTFLTLGEAIIPLKDFSEDPTPMRMVEFIPIAGESESSNNESTHSLSKIWNSLNMSNSFNVYGTLLHKWNIASGNFLVQPVFFSSLTKLCGNFEIDDKTKASCLVLDGKFLNFYDKKNTTIASCIYSIDMLNMKIRKSTLKGKKTLIKNSKDNNIISIEFDEESKDVDLLDLCTIYKNYTDKFGNRIEAIGGIISPTETIKILIQHPNKIIKALREDCEVL